MFNLIPWKKRHESRSPAVRRGEPLRHDVAEFFPIRIREELEELMNRFLEDSLFDRRDGGLPALLNAPRFGWDLDLGWEDKRDEYVLNVELPGFEPEDFDVKVSGNLLTVKAEHKEEQKKRRGASHYRYGSFSRTVTLPHGTKEEEIDARYHSGVLEIHLPKTEEGRGKRIPVNRN